MKAYYQNGEPVESSKLDSLLMKLCHVNIDHKAELLYVADTREQVKALIEEVIGSDEFGYINSKGELREEDANAEQSIRNTLKAEQRQRKDAL